MRMIKAEPLTAEAFRPFGAVYDPPALKQRVYLDPSLTNLRADKAHASYSIAHVGPQLARPLPLSVVERHEFSSQSFTPLDSGRFLVVAGPKNAEGGADLSKMRVFVASDFQSFTYGADVWHGPITPLDGPIRFAIMMFRDETAADEEVVRLAEPFAMVEFA